MGLHATRFSATPVEVNTDGSNLVVRSCRCWELPKTIVTHAIEANTRWCECRCGSCARSPVADTVFGRKRAKHAHDEAKTVCVALSVVFFRNTVTTRSWVNMFDIGRSSMRNGKTRSWCSRRRRPGAVRVRAKFLPVVRNFSVSRERFHTLEQRGSSSDAP